jgi:hypothetical protein
MRSQRVLIGQTLNTEPDHGRLILLNLIKQSDMILGLIFGVGVSKCQTVFAVGQVTGLEIYDDRKRTIKQNRRMAFL